jgi:hypothetical protein
MALTKLIQSLGGRANGMKQRAAAIARYNKNPNHCLQCGSVIEVRDSMKVAEARSKKFCNRSCAGSYNNKLIRKRYLTNHCLCGTLVPSGRKYCSEICRKAAHQLRTKNQSKPKANSSQYVISWRQKAKIRAIKYKGGSCQICGYNKCVRALSFHHLDRSHKDFGIGGISRSWNAILLELDKCILLCANCHAEVHSGLLIL